VISVALCFKTHTREASEGRKFFNRLSTRKIHKSQPRAPAAGSERSPRCGGDCGSTLCLDGKEFNRGGRRERGDSVLLSCDSAWLRWSDLTLCVFLCAFAALRRIFFNRSMPGEHSLSASMLGFEFPILNLF